MKRVSCFVLTAVLVLLLFSCGTPNSRQDELAEKAKTDVRYKWISAFVNGDAEICAEMMYPQDAGSRDDAADRIRDEFSKYTVKYRSAEEKDNKVILHFDIENSQSDVLPNGEYVYDVEEGIPVVSWSKTKIITDLDDDLFFTLNMVSPYYRSFAENDADEAPSARIAYIAAVKFGTSGDYCSAETIIEAAREILGKEFTVTDNPEFEAYEGKFRLKRSGGTNLCYCVLSHEKRENEYSVVCRTFADSMALICSDKVEFVFEKGDGVYPYALKAVNILEETGANPYIWIS